MHSLLSQASSLRLVRAACTCLLVFVLAALLPVSALPAGEEEDVVVVGGDHNYPPYEFVGGNGEPAGYNIELTRAIAEVMGMNIEIRLGAWGQMRKALSAGSVDILQGVAYLERRTGELDYSPPHTIVYQSIWTRKGSEIESLEDLAGREVIVMRGSVMHDFMLEQDLGAQLVFTDTLAGALGLLADGRHDCALVAKLPGEYIVREKGWENIQPLARPIAEQPYGYAVRKGNREMLARFNEGLAILKSSGRYQQIHNRWLGVLEPQGVPWDRIARYGAMVLVPLLLVLGSTVLWSRTLRREVALRTEELEQEVAERRRAMEELKVRQRQLIQADKMSSLGILVSGVAHEINNPNGLILLNLPLLEKAFVDAVPILERHYREQGDFKLGWLNFSRMREEMPHLFLETHESAQRIKRIVNDLKDFARREDSDFRGDVDLNQVARAAVRLVEATIRKATDRFEADYADNLPDFQGNPQRIEQVVVNLVLNACQALEEKSRGIFLATGLEEGGERVVLTLRDEGAGIDPDDLPLLTDPFFTTKRESGGTGLGLSVSAGIVKEHGGELLFDSVPGKGTTVTLLLPTARKEKA